MPTISELPVVSSLNTTDLVPVVQAGITSQSTIAAIADAVAALAGAVYADDYSGVVALSSEAAAQASVTDSTSGLQDALDTGKTVILRNGGYYRLGSGGLSMVAGGRLRCPGGLAYLYCPVGVFTNTTQNIYPTTGCAVLATGLTVNPYTELDNIILEGVEIIFETGNDTRWLVGVGIINVTNFNLNRVNVTGVPNGVGICLNSARYGYVNGKVYDCTTNYNAYGYTPQITAFESDDGKINNIGSEWVTFDHCLAKDITFGAAALAQYTIEQTDGYNFQIGSKYFKVIACGADNVGDGVDIFGDHIEVIGGSFIDCRNVGLSWKHGASFNTCIGAHFLRPGLAGIMVGSGTQNGDLEHNLAANNIIEEVNPDAVWSTNACAAFMLQLNGTPTTFPINNKFVNNKVLGPVTNMGYVIRPECGTNNRFIGNEAPDGYATGYSSTLFDPGDSVYIQNGILTQVRAYVGSNTTLPAASTINIPADTESQDVNSQYNNSTYTFTAKAWQRVLVTAQFRLTSSLAGEQFSITIYKNGAEVATNSSISPGGEYFIRVSEVVELDRSSSITVSARNHGAVDRTITAGNYLSFVSIQEV